jgi:squalene synthase HpnC
MVAVESGNPLSGYLDAPLGVFAKARDENFPVASHLLPPDVRAGLMAVYGFARLADDLGDEAHGDRLALLDQLEVELDRAAAGNATDPVLQRLSPVIRGMDLSLDPFRCLIEANRVDQRVTRYASFDDLVGYCMLSAAPVGRLVLQIFGASSAERIALSDKVCIGLQVVEHLQDIGEDAGRGRIYLPLEDLARFGCSEDELLGTRSGPALRGLVAMEVTRARGLLAAGVTLGATLPLRPRVAVAGFAGGGIAALDAIARAGNDVLATRCRPRKLSFARRFLSGVAAASTRRHPS